MVINKIVSKYIISYTTGSCGNFIAALIHCFQTGLLISPDKKGTLHNGNEKYWSKVYPINGIITTSMLDKNYNIYHTHSWNFDKSIFVENILPIKIRFKEESIGLIFKMAVDKAFDGAYKWYWSKDKTITKDDVLNQMKKDIVEFQQNIKKIDLCIDFEDIWNNSDRLLSKISKITKLPIPNIAMEMIKQYQHCNGHNIAG